MSNLLCETRQTEEYYPAAQHLFSSVQGLYSVRIKCQIPYFFDDKKNEHYLNYFL